MSKYKQKKLLDREVQDSSYRWTREFLKCLLTLRGWAGLSITPLWIKTISVSTVCSVISLFSAYYALTLQIQCNSVDLHTKERLKFCHCGLESLTHFNTLLYMRFYFIFATTLHSREHSCFNFCIINLKIKSLLEGEWLGPISTINNS